MLLVFFSFQILDGQLSLINFVIVSMILLLLFVFLLLKRFLKR